MKNWVLFIAILFGVALYASICQIQELTKKYETAMANIKAYDSQLGKHKEQNIAYQLTIDQMKTFRDSVLRELDETRKKLKIKDKNVQSLHQVVSEFYKTDTLVLRDTLFRDKALAVDTLIGDDWYNVRVGLNYPSMISVTPSFKSEKHIVVSTKRETINPPKKFWLFRLFQKKHTVIKVDVVEKNPHVFNEHSEYIQILR